jgi:hypothetical protein
MVTLFELIILLENTKGHYLGTINFLNSNR